MASFTAGSFECRLISDGDGFLPPEVMFDRADDDERAAAVGARLGPAGVAVPYGCLLLRSEDQVVLVDAGLGAYEHPLGGTGGALVSRLEAAGVAPADVGIVVITHRHRDHIGGLCVDGRPRFPKARHVISQAEWDWLSEDDNPVDREQVMPLADAGILEFADGAMDLIEGIRLIPAPGHTPGQLALEIGSEGGALYLADVILDEVHVEHPEWPMAFDEDGDLNVETRLDLLGRAADEGWTVAAAHIPTPGLVEQAGEGFRFVAA